MAEQNNNSVQLGCGTLIVIAIIVAIFSGDRGNDKVKSELRELNQKVDRLELKIDALNKQLATQKAVPAPVPAPAPAPAH
jgi:outer membrane murein-binding lipoprotein Lpp